MRRARIAIKPNIRPGGRSVTGGEQSSQAPTDGAVTAEKAARPSLSPSPQPSPPEEGPAQAVGVKNTPTSPSEKASTDLSNGAPSSGTTTTPAPVPQRRMRISVTPKLAGPKATSTPRLPTRVPRSVPPTLPKDAPLPVPNAQSETPAPDNLPELNISGFTSPTEGPGQSSHTHPPSSPCLPSTSSTSDLYKPLAHEKKSSVESSSSPSSPQPGQVPQQPPHEPEPHKYPTSGSDMPSPGGNLSCCDVPGSPQKGNAKESDKERILRALKLKELMKIERRKDIKKEKRGSRRKQEYISADRSKMTMGDLIYYLPNTSPMRNSTVCEGTEEEIVVPPSPKVPEKKAPEWEDEEEEEEEGEDEGMLMPKVRVAEDGSIVLDEESLTVRVQRTSTTKAVENSSAQFEQGFTTTYRSFRNWTHVKSWSVRETDMFFLAISMVGTDFSLIGMLLPHRSRTEIKNKFKKEERANSWRIDQAFRNKRPYDREFFSFLLEKVLAKDKEKGKSVKLVLNTPKKRQKARGKKAAKSKEQCLTVFSDDEDFNMEDGDHMEAEKENEDLPNVNDAEASVPAKKKRKRTRTVGEGTDKEDCCEDQDSKKTKKSKRTKKSKKEVPSPEDDSEGVHIVDDSVSADKENEPDLSASALKKKRKRSKKTEEEKQDETPVEGSKSKRSKKSLKVNDSLEDTTSANAESSIVDDGDSVTVTLWRRRSQKADLKEDTPSTEKSSRKKKSQKGTVTNERPAEDGEAKVAAEDGEAKVAAEDGEAKVAAEDGEAKVAAEDGEVSETKKMDTISSAKEKDKAPKRSTKQPKKPTPNLTKRRVLKPSESETTAKTDEKLQESQIEENSEAVVERESRPLDIDKLEKQAVVPVEKTPPRIANLSSPSKVRHKSNEESEDPPAPPADGESSSGQQLRRRRAERVKRSLTTEEKKKKKKGKRKAVTDQDESEHDLGASAEDMRSPTDLLEEMVSQRSEETEDGSLLDENLIDFSCLHHLNSPVSQRKPMVVLSREDVSMILNVENPTDEEDPSVSPLDLSLNTELSFPLQCSNLLMEENAEAAQVKPGVDEHENAPQETPSSSFALEEKQYEDLGLTELLSGWPANSTTGNLPSLASDDVPTSAKDLKGYPHAADLETMPSKYSVYTKSEAPEPLEAVKQGASMPYQGTMVQSNTCMMETSEIKERSQESVVATSKVMTRSQGSVKITPEIKEVPQESFVETSKIIMRSRSSITVTPGASEALKSSQDYNLEIPEIKQGSQESVLATSEALKSSQDYKLEMPEIKQGSQESTLATSEALKSSQDYNLEMPEIKQGSQESVLATSEALKSSQDYKLEMPEIKQGSQESTLATSEALKSSQDYKLEMPEIKQGSQESALASPLLTRSRGSVKLTPAIKEASQESVFQGSTLETPEIKEGSQECVKKSMDLQASSLATSRGSVVATTAVKTISEQASVAAYLGNESSQEEKKQANMPSASSSSLLGLSLKRSRFTKPKPNLFAVTSKIRHSSPKQTMSSEKILSHSTDVDCDVEHLRKKISFKEQEKKAQPCSVNMESEETPVSALVPTQSTEVESKQVCSGKQATDVFEQELVLSSVSSSEKTHLAPKETGTTCDVDRRPYCSPEAEDLQKFYSCPLSTQSAEQETTVQMVDNTEDICTPAKVIQPSEHGNSGEEPTFILTLYEIPVTEVYPATATNNDTVMVPPTLPSEPGGELAQPAITQDKSQQTVRPQVKNEASEDVSDASKVESKEDPELVPLQTETEDILDVPIKESKSESEDDPGLAPLEGMEPQYQSTPVLIRVSKCVASKSKVDALQCKDVSKDDTPYEEPIKEQMTNIPRALHSTAVQSDCKTTLPVKRRAKIQVKPSLVERKSVRKECPKLPQTNSPSSADQETELKTEAETSARRVRKDTTVKHDLESNTNINKSPLPTAHKEDNEKSALSVMPTTTASCFASLDSEAAEAEDCEGVSHMLLADVFVPVSEELGHDLSQDWQVPGESRLHEEKVSLPNIPDVQSKRTEKEEKTKHAKQRRVKTGSTKAAKKQKVDVLNISATETVAGLKAKEKSDSETTEEGLQTQPKIMPCAVKVSRCTDFQPTETEGVSRVFLPDVLVPVSDEEREDASMDLMSKQTELFSPPSTSSKKKSILKETKPKRKESTTRKKAGKLMGKVPFTKQDVKQTKSSESDAPESEDSGLKHQQTAPGMRQLRITSWVKQSDQTGTKLEVLDLSKTSRIETSSLRTKDVASSENEDSVKKEETCGEVSQTVLLPASEDTAGESSTITTKTCKEEPSVSQKNKAPVTRRAKLQVKPTIPKTQTRTKDKGDSSESDQPKSSQPPSSPLRQRTRAALLKKEFEETSKNKPTEDAFKSGKKSAKVGQPREEGPSFEAGVFSGSSPPTSSKVRVCTRTSPPETSQQLKTSPGIAPKEDSPKSSDDTEDEPSRVSQFFLCDIFTEVEDGD
ncbi:transcription factor TFIIIB component B'' homolog isoform X3 [Astyanax mexicanus]|uniref:transcription factor TFIIIB component B'' homolog isoform X3 n=1 Tax=Astyanax mexicanus TaxID=7994 RepID=UPI0020CB3CB4|nr:transcription factor TFIIIB component B'' homolog isoform X3 [Astyanax mexicanus]